MRIKTGSRAFLMMVLLCGCGQESPYCEGGAEELPPHLWAQYEKVEECASIHADPPLLKWALAIECPEPQPVNQRCCLAGEESRPCRDRPERYCGRRGLYVVECKTIVLPEGCDAAFKHEVGHHLLYENGEDGDNENAPEIRQCEWR